MITVKEITTKRGLKQFVKFPFSLYKNNPNWIPPIINDELSNFDKTENPVFEHAEARYFLAYQNNEIVGRVAAIINWTEINEQKIKKMRFGWFDFIDDMHVSKALLDKVNDIGKQNNLEFIEGPVGFSNMDKVGILTEGFNELGTMITWYNHAYYMDHLTEIGYQKSQNFIETYFYNKDVDITKYKRYADVISKRLELKPINFSSSKEIMPYVNEMFDLFNRSYEKLPSFVPISDKQKEYFKKKFINFINPEYIKFIVDKNNKLITFAITMPSFAEAFKKANGKLFPFGIFHLLKAKNNSKEALFLLIGIEEEYQKKGVTAIVFHEFFKTYEAKGIQKVYNTPQLEENKDIQLIWKNFNPKTHKRRSTFKKNIQ